MDLELLKALGEHEFFRDLSPEDLENFLSECQEESLPAGAVVFHEGDPPGRFYVLLAGQVEVWKDYGSPFGDVLAVRNPGACFGEMALVDDFPRSATVVTVTPVRLLSLAKEPFRRVLEQKPQVALLIMKSVSQLVRVSNDSFQYGLRQKNAMLEAAYEDLKRAQDEAIRSERLSTLGKFASLIIHDLRNPLSIVKGYAEVLTLPSPNTERTQLMAGKLLSEVNRLNRMVGEILDYSRGSIRLNLAPVKIGALFEQVRAQYASSLADHNITLEVLDTVDRPLLLDCDRFTRVFSNLVDNGRKAMRHGGVLRLASELDDSHVVVKVSDTGEGMDEATRSRLFEPFFSASSSGGTGLGMLVVSNVVEAHRGTIEVESTLGTGTTVLIRLPLAVGLA